MTDFNINTVLGLQLVSILSDCLAAIGGWAVPDEEATECSSGVRQAARINFYDDETTESSRNHSGIANSISKHNIDNAG